MATMRELKGRINSVHSSQKITGAMKMISSARLRKAENKLLQAEPYRRKLWEIYAHIEKSGCEFQSPLTVKRQVKKVAIVILLPTMDCAELSISIYIKNWWRKYRLIRNGVSGKLPFFRSEKKYWLK